ncbi:hypothetical protein HN385_06900 [archaeon]|jgi:hypothetical protein|nr:hypothetical protein [archaeon]MBT3451001.1 hypothetical protein [archaeon]MBT6868579.1 hypothetical protein [archaeon]MBT7193111.1 hypothetical protein [archaeon]MBT7380428.1 hypothetical protein [archaeon]
MMGSIEKIVGYVIPIAVLVFLMIYMYGGTGALNDAKEKILNFADKFVDIGKEEISAQASVTSNQKTELSNLKNALQKMVNPTYCGSNSFLKYSGLTDFGKDDNLEISFSYNGSGTNVLVKGGASTAQFISSENFFVEGMVPCVIAGSSLVTQNFDNKFLNMEGSASSDYYSAVNSIVITFNTDGLNENRIKFGSDFIDFEGHEWLFTPDNKHVCFFPTKDGNLGCDGDNGFLDDDCLIDTTETTSIPYKVNHGMLNKCT